nr:sugar kinase [Dactylosporangium thailandense]
MTGYTLHAFGELAAHVFAPFPAASPAVDTLRLGRVEITLGGGSALVCQQVTALGHRTRLDAMVGNDLLGGWLLGELARHGIDCPAPIRSGARSTRTLILHAASGTHDITHEPSDGSPAEFAQAAAQVFGSDSQFAYAPGFPGFEPVLAALAATGVTTVVDLGYRPWLTDPDNYRREVLARARFATVCLLSADGLDPAQRNSLMAEAAGQGARVVVATMGRHGVYVLAGTDCIRHVPAVPCRPVNTLGAGDSFAAGLIVALAEGREPVDAAVYACATAAAVISMFPVLPSRADVDTYRSAEQSRFP